MKHIIVCSMSDAVRFAHRFHIAPYAIISLLDADGSMSPYFPQRENFVAALRLSADDCDSSDHGLVALTPEQADRIVRFVEKYHASIETLVIHCRAGASRSPAVAQAIAKFYDVDIEYRERNIHANAHVFALIVQALSKEHVAL